MKEIKKRVFEFLSQFKSCNMVTITRTGEQISHLVQRNDEEHHIIRADGSYVISPYRNKEERNERIKELSDRYTQDEIAQIMNVSQSTVSNVLNGR